MRKHFLSILSIILFTGIGIPLFAQGNGFFETYVIIDDGSSNLYYDAGASTGNPDYQGADLGTYVEGSQLLVGGQGRTFKCPPCDVTGTEIYYSVYSGSPSGTFTAINMPFKSDDGAALCPGGQNQTWEEAGGGRQNILAGLTPGTYTLEIYFRGSATGSGCNDPFFDSRSSQNYQASFVVEAPGPCLLDDDFSDDPALAVVDTDGAWYRDRFIPAAFESDNGRLKISISGSMDGLASRPSGQQNIFYNTQGRKYNTCECVRQAEGELYIPADWANKHRRSDLWATAFDPDDDISYYPIIGFGNVDGSSPTLRYWNGSVGWVNIPGAVNYDAFTKFSFYLDIVGVDTQLVYEVDDVEVGRVDAGYSSDFGNIIVQGYNFNDPGLGTSYDPSSENDYDIFWDNISVGGGPVQNKNTNEYFCTIKSAIDASSAGDTILVEAGTYIEDGQIVIDNDVTVIGAGKSQTIVQTNQNTGNNGDPRGWWLVNAGADLHLRDLTLDGSGYLVWQALRVKGGGSADSVCFENIKYQESGPSYSGFAVAAFGDDVFDISNSIFREIGRVGVLYFQTGVNGSVFEGNIYTGKGAGNWLDYALDISAGAEIVVNNNEIAKNRGVASSDGSISAGVLVSTFFGPETDASISNNIITDNTVGVFVGFNSTDSASADVEDNDLSNNDWAVVSSSCSTDVELICNWHGSTDAATVEASIAGPGANCGGVELVSFRDGGTDASGDTGFQPDPGSSCICVGGPDLVVTGPSYGVCAGTRVFLNRFVRDDNAVTTSFDFYDGDPNNGGTLIGSAPAQSNGTISPYNPIPVMPSTTTTYYVVANSGDCVSIATITVNVSGSNTLNLPGPISATSGQTVGPVNLATMNPGLIIVWQNNNLATGLSFYGYGNIAPFVAASPATSTVTVYGIGGSCPTLPGQFTITVNSATPPRLANVSEQGLMAYPNPFSDIVNVVLDAGFETDAPLTLSDLKGRVVLRETLQAGETQMRLDVAALASGVYVLRLGDRTVRLVK